MYDGFTYFAWFVMAVLFLVVVALIVFIGSWPKKVAVQRNHPQVSAINACSWVGLLLGGAGWIVAFVWAHLEADQLGGHRPNEQDPAELQAEIERLQSRINDLQSRLDSAEGPTA